jgi:hypothetical protein
MLSKMKMDPWEKNARSMGNLGKKEVASYGLMKEDVWDFSCNSMLFFKIL